MCANVAQALDWLRRGLKCWVSCLANTALHISRTSLRVLKLCSELDRSAPVLSASCQCVRGGAAGTEAELLPPGLLQGLGLLRSDSA